MVLQWALPSQVPVVGRGSCCFLLSLIKSVPPHPSMGGARRLSTQSLGHSLDPMDDNASGQLGEELPSFPHVPPPSSGENQQHSHSPVASQEANRKVSQNGIQN